MEQIAGLPHFRLFFAIFGVIWVGGGGYMMFRYPEFFANINARLGSRWAGSLRYIRLCRKLGIVEMLLAAISICSIVISAIFGLSWY